MRLAHLSDLHLGKNVNNYSMIEDQKYILNQITDIIAQEHADAVIIAGDVYDRPIPPADAVSLLNEFLYELNRMKIEVIIIAGNHDSGDRLNFASELLERVKVHIAGTYNGSISCLSLFDEYGPVHFYSVPYLRPSAVNRKMPDESAPVKNTQEAMRHVLGNTPMIMEDRNILIAHQFVAGAQVDENGSEELEVGGTDQVASSLFQMFDYTALGHIHRPQKAGSEWVRYSGSPLSYSFAEENQIKSVPIVELKEKGDIKVHLHPLKPFRKMEELSGLFADVMQDTCIRDHSSSYLRIILQDEQDIPDAAARLKAQYPYLMRLDYDNTRTRSEMVISAAERVEQKTPLELFEEFYELQNGMAMNEEQRNLAKQEIIRIFEKEQA